MQPSATNTQNSTSFGVCLFLKGVLGNTEERPTHRVYIEILTCRAIFDHLEDSRSHGNKWEAERARGQGARPPPLGSRPGTSTVTEPPKL